MGRREEFGNSSHKNKAVIEGISKIRENYSRFEDSLNEFSKNFVPNGAENSAKIAAQTLEEKR